MDLSQRNSSNPRVVFQDKEGWTIWQPKEGGRLFLWGKTERRGKTQIFFLLGTCSTLEEGHKYLEGRKRTEGEGQEGTLSWKERIRERQRET